MRCSVQELSGFRHECACCALSTPTRGVAFAQHVALGVYYNWAEARAVVLSSRGAGAPNGAHADILSAGGFAGARCTGRHCPARLAVPRSRDHVKARSPNDLHASRLSRELPRRGGVLHAACACPQPSPPCAGGCRYARNGLKRRSGARSRVAPCCCYGGRLGEAAHLRTTVLLRPTAYRNACPTCAGSNATRAADAQCGDTPNGARWH